MTPTRNRLRFPAASFAFAIVFAASVGTAVAAENPRVTGFTLMDADTDQPISGFNPISAGATLNLATLPTQNLNIRVNTESGVGSVRVALDSNAGRVENQAPYALAGDDGGNFRPWTPPSGSHVVAATAFTGRNAEGTAGPTASLTFSVADIAATTPAGPTEPTTSAPAPSSCGPMPSAPPAGWMRVMSDTFSENIPLGQWGLKGGTWERPGGNWRARPAGWKDSSGRGTYNSPKTTSQHDSLLDVWIHSEGDTRYVAAPISLVGDTLGQRVSLCMRSDVIPGYKLAFLLWPSLGTGNERGEIDYPEGKLSGGSATAHAFMHYDPKPASGKSQDAFDSGVALQQWHTYTMAWHPQASYVEFYLDGRLFGRSTNYVPRAPMHYIMQMETYMAGQPLPPPAAGHLLVDWVTIDVPAS
jgi:hypothetical protein